jgi:hypothetical protein
MAQAKEFESKSHAKYAQEADRVVGEIKTRGKSILSEEKQAVADMVGNIANALRKSEQYLQDRNQSGTAGYFAQTSDYLAKMAGDLRERDIEGLLAKTRDMAHRQPGLFFGAAVASGFVLARFLKSASTEMMEESGEEVEVKGQKFGALESREEAGKAILADEESFGEPSSREVEKAFRKEVSPESSLEEIIRQSEEPTHKS